MGAICVPLTTKKNSNYKTLSSKEKPWQTKVLGIIPDTEINLLHQLLQFFFFRRH